MTYTISIPINAPRKYNTIKTDAPDYLLAILSHYSSKSDGSCLVCLPSIALPRPGPHARTPQPRLNPTRPCSIPRKHRPPSPSPSPAWPPPDSLGPCCPHSPGGLHRRRLRNRVSWPQQRRRAAPSPASGVGARPLAPWPRAVVSLLFFIGRSQIL